MNAHAFAVPDRPSAPREPEPFDEVAHDNAILDQADQPAFGRFRRDVPDREAGAAAGEAAVAAHQHPRPSRGRSLRFARP